MQIIIKGSPKEIAALERELKGGDRKTSTFNYCSVPMVRMQLPSHLPKTDTSRLDVFER